MGGNGTWGQQAARKHKENITAWLVLNAYFYFLLLARWGKLNWVFRTAVPFSLTPDLGFWRLSTNDIKIPDVASGCFMKSDVASIIINPRVAVTGWGRPHHIWFPVRKYLGLCRFS